MSDSKPSSGSQAVQTILVVVVCVLLTAVVVLFFNKNFAGANSTASNDVAAIVGSDEGEADEVIAERIAHDSRTLANRNSMMERALMKVSNDKENAVSAREGMLDQLTDNKQEIEDLQRKITNYDLLDSQLNLAKSEIASLKQLNEKYVAELKRFRSDDSAEVLKIANTRLQTQVDALEADLALARDTIVKLKDGGAELRKDAAQLIAYREENAELKKQLGKLRYELNRVNFFVKEATSIDPRVTELYQALTDLKGKSGAELDTAYQTIQSELNVKKLRHVKFNEGSSFVADHEEGMIKNDISLASGDSFLLVVGYASTTGTADANYELSAERATSVAAATYSSKKVGQDVKAVFLGQTKRFSTSDAAENQVCEIWEIRK